MDNKEAISLLKEARSAWYGSYKKALDLAIKALEKQEKKEKPEDDTRRLQWENSHYHRGCRQ